MSPKSGKFRSAAVAAAIVLIALSAVPGAAAAVLVPDAGGTAQMPILSDYAGQAPMQIIDGLPGGTTIDITATLEAPLLYEEIPGGYLGGTRSAGGGPVFTWQMNGTGALLGYNRNIVMPSAGLGLSFAATPPLDTQAGFEVHAAPRINGDPIQCFDTQMVRLFSQIFGDPDFDLLRVTAGYDFGLPSPGHTNLKQNGPDWEVDSFFDITYRIDFIGAPGGPLAGMSGSTTGTVHFSLGDPIPCIPEPASGWLIVVGAAGCIARFRRAR